MKQVKFHDIDNNMNHGGIMLDSGDVICGCCGGLLEKNDEGVTWELLKIYDYWVNLTDEICGDD